MNLAERSKIYAMRQARKDKGLCVDCPDSKPQSTRSKWYCDDCLHKMNMRVQKRQEKKLRVVEGGK